MRGETREYLSLSVRQVFQSTLLMRGETYICLRKYVVSNISIHSPHARRDFILALLFCKLYISIHSPHARRDLSDNSFFVGGRISIHSPHARRDLNIQNLLKIIKISIHSPHARRDREISSNIT